MDNGLLLSILVLGVGIYGFSIDKYKKENDKRLDDLDKKLSGLLSRLDDIDRRFDKYEEGKK